MFSIGIQIILTVKYCICQINGNQKNLNNFLDFFQKKFAQKYVKLGAELSKKIYLLTCRYLTYDDENLRVGKSST